MNTSFWRFFAAIFDMVAPPRKTEARVEALTLPDLQELAQGESALPYKEKAVTALVWELKYRKNPRAAALAGAFLAEELLSLAAEELGRPLLIPVPMHAARRRERGYNQTELLCEATLAALSDRTSSQKILGSPSAQPDFSQEGSVFDYAPDILVRTRATPPQQGLPKYERLKNIQGAMQVTDPARVLGRVCVVVDDVTTTGATLEECKRALKSASARTVHCVALARS